MKSDTEAKGWILAAKKRLNKLYNPSLYKPAPKREFSVGDQTYVCYGDDIPTEAAAGFSNTGIIAWGRWCRAGRLLLRLQPPPPLT